MKNQCYLCGCTDDLTRDHIPPVGFFPNPRPDNLITIPCCNKCNQSFSMDDEAFRAFAVSAKDISPAGEWIMQHKVVKNTLSSSPKLRENILKSFGKEIIETEQGKKEMDTLEFPRERGERFLFRITKGL